MNENTTMDFHTKMDYFINTLSRSELVYLLDYFINALSTRSELFHFLELIDLRLTEIEKEINNGVQYDQVGRSTFGENCRSAPREEGVSSRYTEESPTVPLTDLHMPNPPHTINSESDSVSALDPAPTVIKCRKNPNPSLSTSPVSSVNLSGTSLMQSSSMSTAQSSSSSPVSTILSPATTGAIEVKRNDQIPPVRSSDSMASNRIHVSASSFISGSAATQTNNQKPAVGLSNNGGGSVFRDVDHMASRNSLFQCDSETTNLISSGSSNITLRGQGCESTRQTWSPQSLTSNSLKPAVGFRNHGEGSVDNVVSGNGFNGNDQKVICGTKKVDTTNVKKSHRADTRLLCKFCKRQFSNRAHLIRHEQTHMVDKIQKHACELCGKQFTRSDNLIKHKKSKICENGPVKQSVYKCDVCQKGFANAQYLNKHKQRHATPADMPYQCSKCGKQFTYGARKDAHQLKCLVRKSGSLSPRHAGLVTSMLHHEQPPNQHQWQHQQQNQPLYNGLNSEERDQDVSVSNELIGIQQGALTDNQFSTQVDITSQHWGYGLTCEQDNHYSKSFDYNDNMSYYQSGNLASGQYLNTADMEYGHYAPMSDYHNSNMYMPADYPHEVSGFVGE